MFDIVLLATIASCVASVVIVMSQGWHGKYSLDGDLTGIQKFHKKPVPRVGGIAFLAGILIVAICGALDYPHATKAAHDNGLFKLFLAGLPAFTLGLIEDLTKNVSVKARLLATFASALLASWLLGAYLPRLDIWGVDDLLGLVPVALVVTAIAVAGVANAVNIIDGFNGIAGFAVVIMLAGMGFLAWQHNDIFVMQLALAGIGATLGFLLVNYPTGRLFMGDGGAYLAGFWVAEVAVLTVVRNPGVHAWQVLAICGYPVIEVLYSMYRRKVIRKSSPGEPDCLHLHTLIYRRVVCQLIPRNEDRPWIRNAAVACIVATWIATTTLLAVWAGDSLQAAMFVVIVEVWLYTAVYARLVRRYWCLNPVVNLGLWPEARAKRV
jgi:UDP-N-acetylmuramyl pentapeptide phosphotransferase/UDP-N-acetylglucosamine-1-phosphate transferase